MKSKILIIVSIVLIGCSTSKNVESQTDYKRVETVRFVDTTLKAINPIHHTESRVPIEKINRIETKNYIILSYIDNKTAENVLYTYPKHDSIEMKVKYKRTDIVETKKIDEKIIKKVNNNFQSGVILLAVILILLIFLTVKKRL